MQANTTTHFSSHHAGISDSGTEWVLRGIAMIQILGGLFGAGRALALLIDTGHPFNIAAMVCYICGIAAGLLLWQETVTGFATSLIFQIAQVPWILTSQFAYAMVSGVGVWLGAGKAG